MTTNSFDENWDDPSIQEYDDLQKYAFLSQRAVDNNYVGYCYREHSDIKIDSGWRFLYGNEEEEYLDNPDHVVVQDLKDIIEWKPELKHILSARFNTEFEWNPEKEVFEQV